MRVDNEQRNLNITFILRNGVKMTGSMPVDAVASWLRREGVHNEKAPEDPGQVMNTYRQWLKSAITAGGLPGRSEWIGFGDVFVRAKEIAGVEMKLG